MRGKLGRSKTNSHKNYLLRIGHPECLISDYPEWPDRKNQKMVQRIEGNAQFATKRIPSLFCERQPPLQHGELAASVAGEGHLDAVSAHLDARAAVGALGQFPVGECVAPRLGERQVRVQRGERRVDVAVALRWTRMIKEAATEIQGGPSGCILPFVDIKI